MNIELKSPCWHLTIQLDGCTDTTSTSKVHPDNLGPLDPANPNNPEDYLGKWHNDALSYYLERQQPDDDITTIMELTGGYLKKAVSPDDPRGGYFTNLDEFIPHIVKSGFFDDLDTIYWPELPDFWLNDQFNGLLKRIDNFDIETDSYAELKKNIVIIESDVMLKLAEDKDLLELFLGTLSVMRYSTALWVEDFVNHYPGDGITARKKPGRIIRADIRAYRHAISLGSTDPKWDAVQLMSSASGQAAKRG